MKTKNQFSCLGVALLRSRVVPALIATFNLLSVGQAPAQTFTSLGNLQGPFDSPIFLGNTLYASVHGLALSDDNFYGTEPGDTETLYSGALYAVSTDRTRFTNLYTFTSVPDYWPYINLDGAYPNVGLILSGPTLYGTTYWGGRSGNGTIFSVSTNGTDFTVLYGGWDLVNSQAGLILSGNTLYGTTAYGGTGNGSVFAFNTKAIVFTNLHSFTATSPTNTNSDGAAPEAGLILSGNTLYGTTAGGGTGGKGTVFAVNTNGTGFRVLHHFTPLSNGSGTNSDGASPKAGLILSGPTLYGTTYWGGNGGSGTVFAVSINGTDFTSLYSFTSTSNSGSPTYVDTNSDGAFPQAPLALKGNALYGTTSDGGNWGSGTLFSISLQPQLTITRSGTQVILSWPTNVAGFDYTGYVLQSTTNPVSASAWSTNSPAPAVIAGQNTVTNSIIAAQQFYRLIR
jgi:uncharacterized repeat protein (TIGR03803 family)